VAAKPAGKKEVPKPKPKPVSKVINAKLDNESDIDVKKYTKNVAKFFG